MQLVTRADLGWPESAAAAQPTALGVKVHYEGTPVSTDLLTDHDRCLREWQNIRASHLSNKAEGYVDVAYNYAACPHGFLMEGRGIGRRTGANGNQTLNRNHYAIVGLVGDSGLTEPTPEMLNAIRDGIELLQAHGAGPEIRGHRDGYATSCPGGPLYAWVQAGAPRPDAPAQPDPAPVKPPAPAPEPARYRTTINGLEYGYGAHGDHVTAVGEALVARGFGGHYQQGPGPDWSDADTANYQEFQRSLGYSGSDADGVPGEASLRQLLGYLPSAVPAFPGREYFRPGAVNDYVERLGEQLVRRGFGGHYRVGPSRDWGEADRLNVAAFQRSRAELAGDADGYPGPLTWRLLFS
ncbi:peptidoglycan-binding protein [Kitasatospora sp. CM 4170]|uniref:Peptidoglycan-binding protein n=1 Tax=Kitasatospora aburaviensis TaxID=67265 RepID=A0ABW1ER40_9ACTN|nr:peptidoglycan-binding protein [Kitasatospora sp. CM 4170]WNM45631.1 peptidoglycan-binding protein [Kitasatospora sp. CM 4170]